MKVLTSRFRRVEIIDVVTVALPRTVGDIGQCPVCHASHVPTCGMMTDIGTDM